MLIDSKTKFYELASKGLCGNTPKIWYSVDEYLKERYSYPYVTIRYKIAMHKSIVPSIHYRNIKQYITNNNIDEKNIIINEIPLNRIDVLQGELSWINGQWYLYYTYEPGYMRKALQSSGKHMFGTNVMYTLKYYCTPSDYDDIIELFDKYTYNNNYPTIEFSILKSSAGRLLGRNTLIWEIRHY